MHVMELLTLLLVFGCCGFITAEMNESKPRDPYLAPAMDHVNTFMADLWLDGADTVRMLWKDCSKNLVENDYKNYKQDFFSQMVLCAKRKTLTALDRSLSSDVIPLVQGFQLVRFEKINKHGKAFGHVKHNRNENETFGKLTEEVIEKGDWRYLVLERMSRVFNTHVLKINLQYPEEKQEIAEFRHRRRHQMVQMMMFGIMSMGMILVPMGFQFLAVLGGKALLLAKLALILSSIQGLKKIATSPLNYGLYHSFPPTSFETFEKRGYDHPIQPIQLTHTNKLEEWVSPPLLEEKNENDYIKYRFDGDRKTWMPDNNRELKRSVYNVAGAQNVYPVYSVSPVSPVSSISPAEGSFNQYPQLHPGFAPAVGAGELSRVGAAPPQEIHAEYTIDIPVNKVQLRSSGAFIQS